MISRLDYLIKREHECREAAMRATSTVVERTYMEFAKHYADEIESLNLQAPKAIPMEPVGHLPGR
jgi:hypothetical protein